jgi:hypothetical protein
MAMKAPPEKLAFVAMLNAEINGRPDALDVVDRGNFASGKSDQNSRSSSEHLPVKPPGSRLLARPTLRGVSVYKMSKVTAMLLSLAAPLTSGSP